MACCEVINACFRPLMSLFFNSVDSRGLVANKQLPAMTTLPTRCSVLLAGLAFSLLSALLSPCNSRAQVFLETRYPGAAPGRRPQPRARTPRFIPYLSVTGAPPLGSGGIGREPQGKAGPAAPVSGAPKPGPAPAHDPTRDVLLPPPPGPGPAATTTVRSGSPRPRCR